MVSLIMFFVTPFLDGRANELRIDAAEGSYAKGSGQGIAASVRVELSRIWKMKPERSGKNIT